MSFEASLREKHDNADSCRPLPMPIIADSLSLLVQKLFVKEYLARRPKQLF